MNYQSIGSGGGIAQIKAKTVDFGASDMPLKPEDLQAAGLMQFPAIIGGVVPVVNIEGVAPGRDEASRARCSPTSTSARSRSGTTSRSPISIRRVKLPDELITVVRRSDGSGTTFLWTDYLSKVSPEWKAEGRRQHRGVVARRRGRQGQRRCRRLRAADQGLDRLRRVRVRQEEQDGARARCRTRKASSCSPTTTRSRRPPRSPTGRTRRASTRS